MSAEYYAKGEGKDKELHDRAVKAVVQAYARNGMTALVRFLNNVMEPTSWS